LPGELTSYQAVEKTLRDRLPLVIAVTALVVAVLGSTPLGEAEYNATPFARNAGKVNGIRASRTPKPNHLLPLGPNAKFPGSVVPGGERGPAGPQGQPGPGATSRYLVVNPDGTIYKQQNVVAVQKTATGVYQITWDRSVDDCGFVATVGGHRTGPNSWTDPPYKGFTSVRTFGAVAEVRTLTDNGFSGGFQERDLGFHAAAFC
jgi:hypothetical protein